MQNLRQLPVKINHHLGPVKINHHLGITDEERDALVNACAFFHEFFTEGQQCVSHWRDVARDQRLELFDQLATKIARI